MGTWKCLGLGVAAGSMVTAGCLYVGYRTGRWKSQKPEADDDKYYTIKVRINDETNPELRHVYLGTSNQLQQLYYGPPTGDPDEPKHNLSTLFKLEKGCKGVKISNHVTSGSGLHARLVKVGDPHDYRIALDERGNFTEFYIGKIDGTHTSISSTTADGKTIVWYPTEDDELPGKRKIQAKFEGISENTAKFLVEQAILAKPLKSDGH